MSRPATVRYAGYLAAAEGAAGLIVAAVYLVAALTGAGRGLVRGPSGAENFSAGTAAWFESIGMKPGTFHARVAASTELSAGLGLAVGLLTPVTAAGFVALMLVAAWTVHRHNGFFIVKEGWEYNLVLAVAAVAVAALGAGRFSLDYVLFRGTSCYDLLHGWWGFLIAAGLGLAGGIGQLAIFYRPPAKT